MKDYYQVLKVSRSATTDQIKAAYRSLALSLHPDVTRGDKAKEVLFKEVAEAFETLSNSALRRSYDIMYYRGDYSNHSRSSGQSFYRQQSSNTAYKPQARPVRTVSPTQFNVELWNSWHYGDDSVSKANVSEVKSWMQNDNENPHRKYYEKKAAAAASSVNKKKSSKEEENADCCIS